MSHLSKLSLKKLDDCHFLWQNILTRVSKKFKIVIITSFRGMEEQNFAYKHGFTQLKFPQSSHNKKPCLAVDIAPYPVDWKDIPRFKKLYKVVAKETESYFNENKIKGVTLEWGGFYSFCDYVHYELKLSDNLFVGEES